jgi:branched-chain amino acid transport system permease protein
MTTTLLFFVVGLGAGAAYAAIGMALVTTYRGTGVLNIAQGAMAMWAAFSYDELRTTGDLVLPVGRIDLGMSVPVLPAILAGLAAAAGLGLLAHLLVFRPLRTAPALARVVASVGLTIALQALVVLRFGPDQRAVAPILRAEEMRIGSVTFAEDRIWLVVAVVALAGLLWGYGKFTRLGLATRGAAESELGAVVLGYSPDRLAAATWLLSPMVGGLIAILVAPTFGLDPVTWTLIVVPALACALLGRLTSVWVTACAGLLLGGLQAEVTLLSTQSWWPEWAGVGVAESVPFVVIAVGLYVFGKRLPGRSITVTVPLPKVVPTVPRPAVTLGLVAAGAVLVLATSGSYRFGVITSMIFAVIALSLVVLTGYVGQISLAQAAFAGSAGFVLSTLGTAVPFPLSVLLAALAATALGLLVGIPALRIRGAQLAVVTLAAGVAIEQFVFRNPSLTPVDGNAVPAPRLFGIDLGIRAGTDIARWQFGLLVLAVLTLAALAVANLGRSATGRALLAVRSNERAAASVGVNVAAAKLLAFAFSSFLAGLGGALIGYSRGQLSADSFGVFVSLSLLAFAYLGGITSISGALAAGLLAPLGIGYVLLDRHAHLGNYYLLISGLLLVVTAIANQSGIAGQVGEGVAALRRRMSRVPESAEISSRINA